MGMDPVSGACFLVVGRLMRAGERALASEMRGEVCLYGMMNDDRLIYL